MSARVYAEQTKISPMDLGNQPKGKLYLFIVNTRGEKLVFSGDRIEFGPSAVLLLRKYSSDELANLPLSDLPEKGKFQGTIVAAVPNDSDWYIIDAGRFDHMNGKEWEQIQVKDGESYRDTLKEIIGENGVVQVMQMPSGRTVGLPASPDIKEKFLDEKKKDEKVTTAYDDSKLYA